MISSLSLSAIVRSLYVAGAVTILHVPHTQQKGNLLDREQEWEREGGRGEVYLLEIDTLALLTTALKLTQTGWMF